MTSRLKIQGFTLGLFLMVLLAAYFPSFGSTAGIHHQNCDCPHFSPPRPDPEFEKAAFQRSQPAFTHILPKLDLPALSPSHDRDCICLRSLDSSGYSPRTSVLVGTAHDNSLLNRIHRQQQWRRCGRPFWRDFFQPNRSPSNTFLVPRPLFHCEQRLSSRRFTHFKNRSLHSAPHYGWPNPKAMEAPTTLCPKPASETPQ